MPTHPPDLPLPQDTPQAHPTTHLVLPEAPNAPKVLHLGVQGHRGGGGGHGESPWNGPEMGPSLLAQVHRTQRRDELLTNGLHSASRITRAERTGHIAGIFRFV